jgi:Carboxypeptidase regulatory-like domain
MALANCVCTIESWGDSMQLWPKPSRFVVYCLIATSFSLADRTTAQTTSSGALTGVITDQTNAVVRDAAIEIKDRSRGTTRSTKTDREGLYQFFFLVPGKYVLIVAHDGFREERRSVDVLLGPPVTVNVTLAIAQASSEITVADEVPLVHAENGDASASIVQKQISEVPNPGNDLTYIVQTTPASKPMINGVSGKLRELAAILLSLSSARVCCCQGWCWRVGVKIAPLRSIGAPFDGLMLQMKLGWATTLGHSFVP